MTTVALTENERHFSQRIILVRDEREATEKARQQRLAGALVLVADNVDNPPRAFWGDVVDL